MRTAAQVLADLDLLRDRRIAKTVTEKAYHHEQERLWDELREIDRLARQCQRRAQEVTRQKRRDQKIARSRRKLATLLVEPPRHTIAELRRWLEAFIQIDATNQPALRARQRRVEE